MFCHRFSSVWPRAGAHGRDLRAVNHRAPGQAAGGDHGAGQHQRAQPHEEDHAGHIQQALPRGPSGWY